MVPCIWCGKPTRSLGTKQCDACWERNRHGTIPYDTLLAERNALVSAAHALLAELSTTDPDVRTNLWKEIKAMETALGEGK